MRSVLTHHALALVLALGATACGGSLEPREQVSDLRVLGVQLDPPTAVPGAEVAVRSLVVDPSGGTWTARWYACHTPVSFGAFFSGEYRASEGLCGDPEHPQGHLIGEGESASFTVPLTFLQDTQDALKAEGLDFDDEQIAGLLAIVGWHLRVNLIVEGEGGKVILTQKRLVVMGLPDANANPAPPAVHLQEDDPDEPAEVPAPQTDPPPPGECLVETSLTDRLDSGDWLLTPVNVPDDPPEYLVIDFTGAVEERTETLFYSWFSTIRGLDSPVTKSGDAEVKLDIPDDVRASEIVTMPDGQPGLPIWVVARDGRGGSSWCTQTLPFDGEVTPD